MAGDASGIGSVAEMGGTIIGGLLGQDGAQYDREQARQVLQNLLDRYANTPLPELQQLAAQTVGPTELNSATGDPALDAAQYQSISQLGDIAKSGGLTLEDRANLNHAQQEAAQRTNQQRQSVMQSLAARGQYTSGAGTAAQLSAVNTQQQAAADAASSAAGSAQARAMRAIVQRAQTAGSLSNQQYQRKANAAEAQDVINRYNANARTQANQHNAGLAQQQFDNRNTITNGMAGATGAIAANHNATADRTQQQWANLGTGVGQGVSGSVGLLNSQASGTNGQATTAANYEDVSPSIDYSGGR